MTSKFRSYDHATKSYLSMLVDARQGLVHVVDLIPASAAVQDALSEIRDLTKADREYVEAASAVIKLLSDAVKGRPCDDDTLDGLVETFSVMRRRVIVEDAADSRFDFGFLAKAAQVPVSQIAA